MKKQDLINNFAAKTGLSKAAAEGNITALCDVLRDELLAGGKAILPGICVMQVRDAKATVKLNRHTGHMQAVPAKKRIQFRTSLLIKRSINA